MFASTLHIAFTKMHCNCLIIFVTPYYTVNSSEAWNISKEGKKSKGDKIGMQNRWVEQKVIVKMVERKSELPK